MSIVSSTHTLGTIQEDGRRYVLEDHVDQIGKHWLVEYLAPINANYIVIRNARAVEISRQLIANEIARALAVDVNPTLIYAANIDFVPVLRSNYRSSSQVECSRLATWILNRIDDGWVTETQVQNAFGLTTGQWTTLKAKMTVLRTNYQAVITAAGE